MKKTTTNYFSTFMKHGMIAFIISALTIASIGMLVTHKIDDHVVQSTDCAENQLLRVAPILIFLPMAIYNKNNNN